MYSLKRRPHNCSGRAKRRTLQNEVQNDTSETAYIHKEKKSSELWHERLAHQNITHVMKYLKDKKIEVETKRDFFCEACVLGKKSRNFIKSSRSKTKEPGELVHADVCGYMDPTSYGGSRYFLLFKDNFSHYKTVYFLSSKTEVLKFFVDYLKKTKNQLGREIRRLRTDNGLEFVNAQMKEIIRDRGIEHETSVPYTPEQNGSVERENRTIVEAARTMLFAKGLDKRLWAEAVNAAV